MTRFNKAMSLKDRLVIAGCGSALLLACCFSGCNAGINLVFQPLEFPFSNPIDVVRIAAFGSRVADPAGIR